MMSSSHETTLVQDWEYKTALNAAPFVSFLVSADAYVQQVVHPVAKEMGGVKWKPDTTSVKFTTVQFFDTESSAFRAASYLVRWRSGGGSDDLTLKFRDADEAKVWKVDVHSSLTKGGVSCDNIAHKGEVVLPSDPAPGMRVLYSLDNKIDATCLTNPLPLTLGEWSAIFPGLAALGPADARVGLVNDITVQQLQVDVGTVVFSGEKGDIEAKMNLAAWFNAGFGANPWTRALAAEMSYAFKVHDGGELPHDALKRCNAFYERLQQGNGASWLDRTENKTASVYNPKRAEG